MKKKLNDIKMFLKRQYLFLRYKLNKNSGKLLIQKESDRRLGLTTMMLKDCVKNKYCLFVRTNKDKKAVLEVVNELNYTIDVLCPSDDLHGRRNLNVVIDNHCSFEDVHKLLNTYGYGRINIVNGFVYEPLAR